MLKKIRYHAFVLPMVFSLILLSGLLIYWLHGEYQQVKRVVSMESSMNKMILHIKSISGEEDISNLLDTLLNATTNNSGFMQFPIGDSLNSDHFHPIRVIQPTSTSKGIYAFRTNDSSLLNNEYSSLENILNEDWEDLSLTANSGFYLRKMLPQIAFALLLLLSTISAFYIIWKSWLKEKQLTRFRDDFISNISHELKTPMNTIGVAIEAIDSFNASTDRNLMKEYIAISKSELERLNNLVDKAIAIDIPDKAALSNSMQKLDLKEVLNQLVHVYQIKFDESSGQLLFNSSGAGFFIKADPTHITNVFYNLMDNALKYKSEKDIFVEINLIEKNKEIEVQLSDNGIGISKAYYQSIFKKFFRIPQDNLHNVKGHGLGLNYVKKIIDLHNGEISVKSEEGAGSCFIITLPKC